MIKKSKYLKNPSIEKQLITWQEFEKKFKPIADKWFNEMSGLIVVYNDMEWWFNLTKMQLFGTKIKVHRLYNNENHTHQYNGFYLHESWFKSKFEPIEFITEEEFKV